MIPDGFLIASPTEHEPTAGSARSGAPVAIRHLPGKLTAAVILRGYSLGIHVWNESTTCFFCIV